MKSHAKPRFTTAALLLATFGATATFAGPFGLNMGESLNALKPLGLEPTGVAGIYEMQSVPDPHPDFEHYSVGLTSEDGLCKVMATSYPIATSAYGDDLKSQFQAARDALNAKYGKGKDYDFLKEGSDLNAPKDWMMGLVMKERVLVTYWVQGNFPDGIASIALEARADDSNSGTIRVGFEFKNFASCKAKASAAEDAAL